MPRDIDAGGSTEITTEASQILHPSSLRPKKGVIDGTPELTYDLGVVVDRRRKTIAVQTSQILHSSIRCPKKRMVDRIAGQRGVSNYLAKVIDRDRFRV